MNVKEITIVFGIFILIFYSASAFVQSFGISATLPSAINSSWSSSINQIESARNAVSNSVEKIVSGNPLEKMTGILSLAFNGIYYIIVSLWTTFVSIPSAIWSGINYLASNFGISTEITAIFTSIIAVVVILKAIEFVTGRQFT